MKIITKICIFFALLFVLNITIFACSCADPSQRQKFRMSNSVFLGEVTEIRDGNEKSEGLKYYFHEVKFKVQKQWKGKKSNEIIILADYDKKGWCGDLDLKVGKRFLIYSPKRYGKLIVNQDCPISRNAEYAKDEIKTLNNFFFRTYSFMFPFPKF